MTVARAAPFLGLLLFAVASCTSNLPSKYDPSKHERAYQLYEGRRLPDAEIAYISPASTDRWGIRLDTIGRKAIKGYHVVAVLPGRHVVGVRPKYLWSFQGKASCADLVFRAEAGGVYRVVPVTVWGGWRRRERRHVIQIVNQRTGLAIAEAKIRRRRFLEGRCTPRGS